MKTATRENGIVSVVHLHLKNLVAGSWSAKYVPAELRGAFGEVLCQVLTENVDIWGPHVVGIAGTAKGANLHRGGR